MTHFLADDGEKIHLKITGEGSPVVMLHGWTSSHNDWTPFVGELSKHHAVYRWDARGHGGHTLTKTTQPTVSRMARDLKNLLEHYALEGATVVGHSMGALTMWEYIRHYGCTHLAKVVFIDQSPRLTTDSDWKHGIYGDFDRERALRFVADLHDDFAESVLRLGANGLNQRAREKYAENHKGWQKSREQLKALVPHPLITCWESLTAADYRDVLGKISIPALLVYGDQSNYYHAETAHWVRDRIPNAILHFYEGTDHCPHLWQRERFARELLAFIGASSLARANADRMSHCVPARQP